MKQKIFMQSQRKMLDVNQWHQVAGIISATFQLVDAMVKR
jgi:hypothetical protein